MDEYLMSSHHFMYFPGISIHDIRLFFFAWIIKSSITTSIVSKWINTAPICEPSFRRNVIPDPSLYQLWIVHPLLKMGVAIYTMYWYYVTEARVSIIMITMFDCVIKDGSVSLLGVMYKLPQ